MLSECSGLSRGSLAQCLRGVGVGKLWGRLSGKEGRRTLSKELMATVDKEWVGVMAEMSAKGSPFLGLLGPPRDAPPFCVLFPLPSVNFRPHDRARRDLSSARRMSTGVSFLQLGLRKGECVQTKFSRGMWGPWRQVQSPQGGISFPQALQVGDVWGLL